MRENEMFDKYQDLAGELNIPLNVNMTMAPIVVSTPGNVVKDLENKMGEVTLRKNSDNPNHITVKIS